MFDEISVKGRKLSIRFVSVKTFNMNTKNNLTKLEVENYNWLKNKKEGKSHYLLPKNIALAVNDEMDYKYVVVCFMKSIQGTAEIMSDLYKSVKRGASFSEILKNHNNKFDFVDVYTFRSAFDMESYYSELVNEYLGVDDFDDLIYFN